jgi:hypothetical protein
MRCKKIGWPKSDRGPAAPANNSRLSCGYQVSTGVFCAYGAGRLPPGGVNSCWQRRRGGHYASSRFPREGRGGLELKGVVRIVSGAATRGLAGGVRIYPRDRRRRGSARAGLSVAALRAGGGGRASGCARQFLDPPCAVGRHPAGGRGCGPVLLAQLGPAAPARMANAPRRTTPAAARGNRAGGHGAALPAHGLYRQPCPRHRVGRRGRPYRPARGLRPRWPYLPAGRQRLLRLSTPRAHALCRGLCRGRREIRNPAQLDFRALRVRRGLQPCAQTGR